MTQQELENKVAAALGSRFVWALHTEPVRIVMRMLADAEKRAEGRTALREKFYEQTPEGREHLATLDNQSPVSERAA